MINSIITGTGHYLPEQVIPNEAFINHKFYDTAGEKITKDNLEVVNKLNEITGIRERRYAKSEYKASDLAFFAAEKAIDSAKIDEFQVCHPLCPKFHSLPQQPLH